MIIMSLKVGIVTTSVRENRVGLDVAKWVLNYANSRKDQDVTYEIVDLKNFDLPILGLTPTEKQGADLGNFMSTMASFDAYVFVVAEYNHAPTGAIKNALDFLNKELNNKAVGYVGYGGLGGIRAIEHLRQIHAELQMASVQKTVNFLLAYDFENFSVFKPSNVHEGNAKLLFDQLLAWGKALKTIR